MTVADEGALAGLEVPQPALLFDLDGTLVDSVYQHVIAWQEALTEVGIPLSVWRIHRRIGMSGGLFLHALQRETGVPVDDDTLRRLSDGHARAYLARARRSCRCPVPVSCCTTSRATRPVRHRDERRATDGAHGDRHARACPQTCRGDPRPGRQAKPDPHLFLAAAHLLGVRPEDSFVVGDSVWDLLAAQRAGALGIGLLSGGYGREELERSGAYRVYADPAEMLTRLEEVGVRP